MTYMVTVDRGGPFGLTMANTFGEWLKAARDKRGLSQRQLALASGVDPSLVSKYESGDTGAPRRPTIEKIADALQVELSDALKAAGFLPSENAPEVEYLADFIPIPEGYNDLDDPFVQAAAARAAQQTYRSVVDALREHRAGDVGVVGGRDAEQAGRKQGHDKPGED